MEKDAFEREILARLREHKDRYPAMEWEDVVKFVFQAMLGVGHLLSSRETVEQYIVREMSGLTPDPEEPLFEELSPAWGRLHLRRAMAEGITAHSIAALMFAPGHAGQFSRQDVYAFCTKLTEPPEPDGELLWKILDETVLPSHSAAYRAQYHPAYRVVSKDAMLAFLRKRSAANGKDPII